MDYSEILSRHFLAPDPCKLCSHDFAHSQTNCPPVDQTMFFCFPSQIGVCNRSLNKDPVFNPTFPSGIIKNHPLLSKWSYYPKIKNRRKTKNMVWRVYKHYVITWSRAQSWKLLGVSLNGLGYNEGYLYNKCSRKQVFVKRSGLLNCMFTKLKMRGQV